MRRVNLRIASVYHEDCALYVAEATYLLHVRMATIIIFFVSVVKF